jgi:membrane protease YdiL (CAAX protease family)
LLYRRPGGLWRRLWAGWETPLLVPALVVCALAAPVVYFMWPWFAASGSILPEWLARYGLTGWAWLCLLPYFSIVHPILEEIHWRGISPGPVTGICRQDLLFAGYHVLVLFQPVRAPWLLLVFAVLAGSSVFWRWAAERFGGYGLPVLTHAVADAAVVVGVHFLLQA